MENNEVVAVVVVENVNVVPPLPVVGDIGDELVEPIAKSEGYPTVGPCADLHDMMQTIVTPTRRGLGTLHDSVDRLVGTEVKQAEPR
jgi:hypothetical protein